MVRMALIGCGANAAPYLAATQQLPDAAITAVADADPERADRAARTAGAEVRAGTLDELLDSAAETFDAVIVTTPAATHAALVQRAVQAGKHALVEPPLARTASEAHQVAAAAHAAGVRLMLAHPARFQADHRAVKDSLDDGELGRPGLLRIHHWFPATDGSERAAHAGLAALDLALWVFGSLPTHVYAVARPAQTTGLAAAEYAQVHLGFAGGGMALIDLAHTLPTGDGYDSLTLIGSLGAAHADDAPQRAAAVRRRSRPSGADGAGRIGGRTGAGGVCRGRRGRTRAGGGRRGRTRCAAGRRRSGIVVGRSDGHDADGGPL